MSDFGIDDLTSVVRAQIEAGSDAAPADTPAEQWRDMTRRYEASGTVASRTLGWIERKARRILHEIRRRRAA